MKFNIIQLNSTTITTTGANVKTVATPSSYYFLTFNLTKLWIA